MLRMMSTDPNTGNTVVDHVDCTAPTPQQELDRTDQENVCT